MSSEARILTKESAAFLAAWCKGHLVMEEDALDSSVRTPGINLWVDGRVQRASMGDTIIRKNDGTFDIFKNP